jgi:hypothetical protein
VEILPVSSHPNNLTNSQENGAPVFHALPKGYPQRHMYKNPKIDADSCQVDMAALKSTYLGKRSAYLKDEKTLAQVVVYADQDRHEALHALKPECKDEPTFRAIQGSLGTKRRKKRSLSFDYERVVFTD